MNRYRELAVEERIWLWRAVWTVILVRVALWLVPFRTLRGFASGTRPHWQAAAPCRIAWAVNAAANRIPHATCLTRAVALQILLARTGQASRVEIGVTKAREEFGAHAWLTAGGSVLIGGGDAARHRPLFGWDAGPSGIRTERRN